MEIDHDALDRHITGNYGEDQFTEYDGDVEEIPEGDEYLDIEEKERLGQD